MLRSRVVSCAVLLFAACGPKAAPPTTEPTATSSAALVPTAPPTVMAAPAVPKPLIAKGHHVDWWFAFKFNSATFSACDGGKTCPFGGTPQPYPHGEGEQFAFASSESPQLAMKSTCIGETDQDPVGATFEQVWNGTSFYVLWNDQFYEDPKITGCGTSCGAPSAHSKGMVAWSVSGRGFVMQVSTPSWPAAGNHAHPRSTDGNTLGCVKDDNVMVSQHFFSLALTHEDLVKVLGALVNASVVTDVSNEQIVHNGGPDDVQALVKTLGHHSTSTLVTKDVLSTGATLISKPSALHVPPWQMVSATLGGTPLRAATWWEGRDPIPSTTATTPIECWDASLGHSGPVEIATTGTWQGKTIGLTGGLGKDFNHAKIGVSTDASNRVIFGDMNQEGSLAGKCTASQNGRGGLFFVVENAPLHDSVASLIHGQSAPIAKHP